MTLSEALRAAEAHAGRPLQDDEVRMVAQLVERGADAETLVRLFDKFERPADVDEDEVPVNRYEMGMSEDGGPVARRI